MYKISDKTLKNAYRPFDIVTNKKNDVGYIKEVNLNNCQDNPKHQVSYSVTWLIGTDRSAWFSHTELKSHCNLFVKFAQGSCHPFGSNKRHVKTLMKIV